MLICLRCSFQFYCGNRECASSVELNVEVVCKTKILRHMNMNGRKWSTQMWGQGFEIAIYWHYRLLIIKYLIVKLLFDNNNIVFEININILSNSSWYKHVWYVHQCSRFYTKQRVSVKGFSIYMYTKNNSVLNLKKNISTCNDRKSAAMGKSGKPWSCFGVCIRKTSLWKYFFTDLKDGI